MIVVVGQPFARRSPTGWVADGSVVRVAAVVAGRGGRVEILGRIGEDEPGEAIVLDLTRRSVGHAAVIRSPGRPTPILDGPPGSSEPLGLDAGDVELGLRYFVDLTAVVVVDPVPSSALETAARIAAAQEAALVVVAERGEAVPAAVAEIVPGALVLEAPGPEGRSAFDRLVGEVALRLGSGMAAEAAFGEALAASGWEPVRRGPRAGARGTAGGREASPADSPRRT